MHAFTQSTHIGTYLLQQQANSFATEHATRDRSSTTIYAHTYKTSMSGDIAIFQKEFCYGLHKKQETVVLYDINK